MEGYGVFEWPDGRKYEGEYKDGLYDGPAAGGEAAVAVEAPKKEEKKVVEEDVDMGDLFVCDDDY